MDGIDGFRPLILVLNSGKNISILHLTPSFYSHGAIRPFIISVLGSGNDLLLATCSLVPQIMMLCLQFTLS